MSNIQVYRFHETGAIPGIPGEWHAGQVVEVDMDTMTVLNVRLTDTSARIIDASEPPDKAEETLAAPTIGQEGA